ncbi:MAG: hypothetical protein J6W06_07000 [Bacteroidales bacterium]|nr:hypothetical protein [Bacteroidales bacterium]
MVHIKKLNEMVNANGASANYAPVIFRIANAHITVNDNHYTNGEDPDMSEETDIIPEGNGISIVNCVEKYINRECDGHKFNPDELHFTEMTDGTWVAEYLAMSSIQTSMFNFKEPTQKEWKDYRSGNIELRSFIFQMSIVKEVLVTKEDFEKEGLDEW